MCGSTIRNCPSGLSRSKFLPGRLAAGELRAAEGNFCQFIYVYPPADLVLVRHGYECGGAYWTGLLGDIAQAVEAELDE